MKIRLSGEELVYEDASHYVYSYNAVSIEGVGPSYLMEGHHEASLDETKELLQVLASACKDQAIERSFDYEEVDSDGEQIGEEYSL